MKKDIVIGCDNAAVDMKEILRDFMRDRGYHVEDMGCASAADQTVYPKIAQAVCQQIIDSGYTKEGVLVCGTGLGMAMCANKFKGIRAGVCHDSYSGERLKLSNNGNVICFGARVIAPELAKKILAEWLELEFVDGASTPKVADIGRLEQVTMK